MKTDGIRWWGIAVVTLLAASPATADSPLSWRGIEIGMNAAQSAALLRKIGLFPKPIAWGGRQQSDWEGTMAAFPSKGHCTGQIGEQCEEVFLSFVRQPSGQEIVWIISAHAHINPPTFVERIIGPAIDRWGQPQSTAWGNERRLPNGVVEYPLFGAYWYPAGAREAGEISVSLSIFPYHRADASGSLSKMPGPEARSWGVDTTVIDPQIGANTRAAYENIERKSAPPVRY
jgi:hypothetical protein